MSKIRTLYKRLKSNWDILFVYRLILSMIVFSICRIAFFIINKNLFAEVELIDFFRMAFGGLKFDLVAILYTNILFFVLCIVPFKFRYNIIYQRVLKFIYILCNSIGVLVNCIDMIYFRFTMRRMTFSVFTEFENEQHKFELFKNFLGSFWYIFILFMVIIYLLNKAYGKPVTPNLKFTRPIIYYPVALVFFSISIGLFIAGARGGFGKSTRPITLSNAGDYTKSPLQTNIVLNSAFTMLKTIGVRNYERVNFFQDQKKLEKIYNPIKNIKQTKAFKPLNVVILILESNAKEYYGFYNKDIKPTYKGYTPFMDSLISQSLSFKYSYASGHKSIDAMPSVLCGIPYMVEPFITTSYSANNKINSLASLLKPKGYYTAFFHGAPNGSMGFQAFANMTGYNDYFGKNEYNNDADFDNIWGIWDEEFFQFYAHKMNTFKQPFFTTLFSLSSHQPFKVPARYEGKFPMGTVPIHQCIGYTDMALRKFFKTASKMPWYKNTLFVLTADHTNQKYLEKYKTELNQFAVPIIFYCPSENLSHYNETEIVQHIDIMPSILSYINYDKPYFAYGFDAFNRKDGKNFAINYKDGYYQLLKDKYLLRFDGKKTVGLFDFKSDEKLSRNLLSTQKAKADSLTTDVKAFIQQYNNRMLDNKLVP